MTLDPRPFLKWAGGKRVQAPNILNLFPRSIETYYEPFVGGGAVYFSLVTKKPLRGAVLNDYNAELMNVYRCVRDFPDELIEQVKRLAITKDVFMRLREKLPSDFSPVRRAARTLFLNKTCFNGLYRVNRKGVFNVSYDDTRKTPPVIVDPENIRACSEFLSTVKLMSGDFEESVKTAQHGDVVYFDPPYIEVSNTANFTSYTSNGFTMDDQARLAKLFRELAHRGVAVIASNSDTPPVRDLYVDWEIHEVQARRNINSKGDRRGPVGELLIVGRPR